MDNESYENKGKGGLSLRDVALAAAFSTATIDNAMANSPDPGLVVFVGGGNSHTISFSLPPIPPPPPPDNDPPRPCAIQSDDPDDSGPDDPGEGCSCCSA